MENTATVGICSGESGGRKTVASLSLTGECGRAGEGEHKALQVIFGLSSNSHCKLRFYSGLFHKHSHVLCGTRNATGHHVGVQSLWVLQKHRTSVEK